MVFLDHTWHWSGSALDSGIFRSPPPTPFRFSADQRPATSGQKPLTSPTVYAEVRSSNGRGVRTASPECPPPTPPPTSTEVDPLLWSDWTRWSSSPNPRCSATASSSSQASSTRCNMSLVRIVGARILFLESTPRSSFLPRLLNLISSQVLPNHRLQQILLLVRRPSHHPGLLINPEVLQHRYGASPESSPCSQMHEGDRFSGGSDSQDFLPTCLAVRCYLPGKQTVAPPPLLPPSNHLHPPKSTNRHFTFAAWVCNR